MLSAPPLQTTAPHTFGWKTEFLFLFGNLKEVSRNNCETNFEEFEEFEECFSESLKSFAKTMRPDKRDQKAIRQTSSSTGTMKRSDGSAKFSFGDTSVLCAVLGPTASKLRNELMDKSFIKVVFTSLSGGGSTLERLYERVLTSVCETVILTSLHPRTMIKITIQTLDSDGGILSAAINALTLALMDAGIALKSTCTAVTVMVHSDGRLLIDPTKLELEESQSSHTFAFDSNSRNCVVDFSYGCFTKEEYDACYELASYGCQHVFSFVTATKKVLEEQATIEKLC